MIYPPELVFDDVCFMKNKRLKKDFFENDTVWVAKNLLGKILVNRNGKKITRALITETEAYCGFNDKASHASRGMTPRNKLMFGPAGHAYIYLVYGMHYCLNVVTEKENYPAAVLIRGVKIAGNEKDLNGPGKLTKFLNIGKNLNGEDMTKSNALWIENSNGAAFRMNKGPRIGVDYAGDWAKKYWRFWID